LLSTGIVAFFALAGDAFASSRAIYGERTTYILERARIEGSGEAFLPLNPSAAQVLSDGSGKPLFFNALAAKTWTIARPE
jgi:hypothetical protein